MAGPLVHDRDASRRTLSWGLGLVALAGTLGALPAAEPLIKESSLRLEVPPKSIVFDSRFSADGKLLALGCLDKSALIFDPATGGQVVAFTGHSERVWTVVFDREGKSLAACTGEFRTPNDPGEVRVWDLTTGKVRHTFMDHKGLVFSVAFSRDGKTVVSGSWDTTVKLWDLETGKEKATLRSEEHTSELQSLRHLVCRLLLEK